MLGTLRYTKHQVARGARSDLEQNSRIYLIKNVSRLRATYQVRLLLFRALETRQKLVLLVPQGCKLAPDLAALRREHPRDLLVERRLGSQ